MQGEAVQTASVLAGYYFLAGNETLREQQEKDQPAYDLEELFLEILEVRLSLWCCDCWYSGFVSFDWIPGVVIRALLYNCSGALLFIALQERASR